MAATNNRYCETAISITENRKKCNKMNQKNNKRIIIVLGMHRSGTSVITRGLSALGVGIGDNLVPAAYDNPTGFWEDKDIVAFNDRLLHLLGYSYESLALVPDNLNSDPRLEPLKLEAINLLKNKIDRICLWAVKDPRMCRLLSFWKPIFSHVGVNAEYVIAVRNPLSTAKSLDVRNQFPLQKSLLLWVGHYVAALSSTHDAVRVFIDYDRLIENPRSELKRLSNNLRLYNIEETDAGIDEFVGSFLSKDLCHTQYTLENLKFNHDVPTNVIKAYELLLSASDGLVALNDEAFIEHWNQIEADLKENSPIFEFLNERDYSGLMKDIEIKGLREHLSTRDNETISLNQALDERDAQFAVLSQGVAERDAQIAVLSQGVAERDAQIAVLSQGVAECDGQLNQLETRCDDLETLVQESQHSSNWQDIKPLRFIISTQQLLRQALKEKTFLFVRAIYQRLPLSFEAKQKVKSACFTLIAPLIHKTSIYRQWALLSEGDGTSYDVGKQNIAHASSNGSCPARVTSAERSVEYVEFNSESLPIKSPIRLIAFYLPQFHPIPENDAWWGKGFTEWANVSRALPQFQGHYQPHLPSDLGFYDLRLPEVQQHQVELAKSYGLGGFCFYFYWFGGKRLLEQPIRQYLENPDCDLPFCLCWANENWSRRWDGRDQEVLIKQRYSEEDDLAFIEYISEYMLDTRYIRIDGRPLLLVYRPSLLPDIRKTAARWRQWCRNNGVGEIYLAYTQSFEKQDPSEYGFDAAIEFPPNNTNPPNITNQVSLYNSDFRGTVYDWQGFVERSRNYTKPKYTLFRGVCPSWDNEARRSGRGTVFLNSSPSGYQEWLENACADTAERFENPDERLVFVNAWNEWAEGAHLEPDVHYGYAYLQATRDALNQSRKCQGESVLLVTHDCHPHGAQFLILETAKQLKGNGINVAILALGEGRLLDDFAQVGETLNARLAGESGVQSFLAKLRSQGTLDVITSTVVCGSVLPQLKDFGFRVLSLIHELPGVIREMNQEANAEAIARFADKVVFPAELVFKRFCEIAPVTAERVVIRPQGVLRQNPYKNRRAEAHRLVCEKHKLPPDTQIVLGIAYVDSRKGPDLFVEMAAQVVKERPKTVFIWIGHADREMERKVAARINKLGLQGQVLFIGFDRHPMAYYAAASVYALPSREDPFPNVVLEAAEVGVPVVAFQKATGACDFIVEHGGCLAKYLDADDFARQVCTLLANPTEKSGGSVGSLQQYSLDLLYHLNGFPRISVVVPNYNYEQYITERLNSIYNQTFPIYEVIVLDDASSDNSLEIIEKYLHHTQRDAQLIVNDSNSGSVFRQWQKGISCCKGDLVWIAEADDLSEAEFLDEMVPAFSDSEIMLGYCQSKQIDKDDNLLAHNYLEYTKDISDSWKMDYVDDGIEEIQAALSIKNTIPNVSAALFRRQALEKSFARVGDDIFGYRVAGDWLIYVHVLMQGKVNYNKKNLNLHRRHTGNVTNSTVKFSHIEEVSKVQVIARGLTTPSCESIEKANAYIDYLERHFELGHKKAKGSQYSIA